MAETELDPALFNRRIEFQLAKKPFTRFGNKSSNGFKLVTLNPTTPEPPPVATAACKKNEKSFEENGLDPELSFEISFRRIGAGLRNLGNTCFLNSVLQCLTYTEPLAAYLQSGKHQNSCRTSGFCALCAIQKHVSRALQSTGRTLEPKDLVYNLRRISRNFRNASQEDAHEYMVNLLESMHKCCLPNGVPSESPSAYDKSLVHKIFGGRLQSQVKCMQCSYCSNKFDPFLDLSLEIMKANSLDKALAHFTAKEQLDGGAKEYQCQQCKQKVKALKQLTIHKAPNVLTVHLKRFGSHALVKNIDKKIEFGPTLDLKPFVTDPYDGNLNYTLYGVLVHHGWSTHSGHYYCFVRTSSGMWYALDDNEVFQVNERKVLDQKAYMLFYVRDRKNFCAKKAVNTMQKESMAMNGRVNAAYPKRNTELREKIQNGSEKKLNGSFSVALPEGNGLVSTPIEETPSVNTSLPNINGTMGVEKCLFSKHSCEMNPIEAIQKKRMVVNGNGDAAYSKLNLEFTEKFQIASIEKKLGVSFSGGLSEGDAVVTTLREETHSEKTPMPNTDGTVGVDNIIHSNGVVEEQNTAAVILSNSEMPQDSLHMNESVVLMSSDSKDNSRENASVTEKVSNGSVPGNAFKIIRSSSEVCVTKDMPVGAIAEVSNKANHVLSSQENSFENIQVGVSSVIAAVPMIEGTCDNEQRMDDVSSKELSGLPATTEPCLPATTESCLPATTEPLPHRRKTKKRGLNLKARRKLFKCHIGSASLSSHIILGAGLCVRNKKHKRRKDISLQKTSNGNILLGNDLASDIGQSVPKELFPGPVNHHTHSKKKKARSGSDGQNQKLSVQNMISKDIISNDVIHNEYRERVVQDGTTLSFKKETLVSQSSARESGNSEEHRKESRQTDIVSMLTGLNERTVARWDEVDTSHLQKSETREAGIAQIGHIGDEWDEEYDRGKRKKVRISKISFGGPNVFQELATRNTKRKRAKLERSRFANQPFRI